MQFTEEQITAAARKLCDLSSEACGVHPEDNWKEYGEEYKIDARLALEAAGAAQPQAAAASPSDLSKRLRDLANNALPFAGITLRTDEVKEIANEIDQLARQQAAPVMPTKEMTRAAVVYINGPDVYDKLPAVVLEIEESIYHEVYLAMLAAAPAAPASLVAVNQQDQAHVMPPTRGTDSQHDAATSAGDKFPIERVAALVNAHTIHAPHGKSFNFVGFARDVADEVASRCRAQGGNTKPIGYYYPDDKGAYLLWPNGTVPANALPLYATPAASADAVEARNQALEEAARMVEGRATKFSPEFDEQIAENITTNFAASIRALKSGVLRTGEGADK